MQLKKVGMKIFYYIDFFNLLLWSDDELLMSRNRKKNGVTNFVSEMRRVQKYILILKTWLN